MIEETKRVNMGEGAGEPGARPWPFCCGDGGTKALWTRGLGLDGELWNYRYEPEKRAWLRDVMGVELHTVPLAETASKSGYPVPQLSGIR